MSKNKEKAGTGRKIVISLVVLLLLLTAGAYGYGVYYFSSHFLPGSMVNGFNCSYMTREDTESLLDQRVKAYVLAVETMKNGQEAISAKDVDLSYVSSGIIRKLIRDQERFTWFLAFNQNKNYDISESLSYNTEMMSQTIDNLKCMQADNIVQPVDAQIQDTGECFEIIPEVTGNALDRTKTEEVIAGAMLRGRTSVNLEEESCYLKPSVYSTDTQLQANCEKMNQLCDIIITQKYGAIVVATGFDVIKLDNYDEYAYSQSKDVITSLELERIMNAAGPTKGHLERLSDGKVPKEMVFIQCVGSRCADDRGKSYCSKICCMYTAKHAMLIRDKYPDVNVTVFYIDVRTAGKNFDEFYRRAVEQYGVNYIKGQVGKVIPQPDGKLLVQGVDLLDNKQIKKEADMVVLAAAIEPNPDVRKIATMLTASIDTNNFLTEAHAKLRPVESPTAGIFLSGVCQGPKDIPETVAQAGAAAVKVIGLLAKDKLTTNPCTAQSDELLCNGCSTCANVCPYGAISYEDHQVNDHGIRETRRVAVVNGALCQGCGACTVACPSGAMDLKGFSNRQIIAEVDAICR